MYLITYPVGLMGEKENDMEQKFCQSCGMPLGDETLLETESSGKNAGNIVFIASKRALSPRTA
mgnify:CR=1 FL=1